jgi:energy-coupling factor transport system permease protein
MVLLVFTRDLATPLAFIVIAYVIVLLGARLTARVMLLLFVALPAAAVVIGASMSLDRPARVGGTVLAHVGSWT